MTLPSSQLDLLACAVAAARAAGQHALAQRHRCRETLSRSAHDVKLRLDVECQQAAEAVIRSRFPGHAILGEEGASGGFGGGVEWIVDPLDGTVNFFHGLPLWANSVAVRQGEEVLAGAVFVPDLDECYTATLDGPAECNGRAIRVSDTPGLDEGLVLTSVSKHVDTRPEALQVLARIAARARKVRVMGAAAVDLCHVACGRADGYIEQSIYLWDVAAAGLIARRAGGRTEILERYSPVHLSYLCTNGRVHEELKNLVAGS